MSIPKIFLALSLVAATQGIVVSQTVVPELNDGEAHGDAPYLIEDGWRSLQNGRDLAGWQPQDGKPSDWLTVRGVVWERLLGPTCLRGIPAPAGTMLNGPTGRPANFVTTEKFGDTELYVEFMIPKGSNSGVYLHGLYELQVFDSYGSSEPMKTSDCGGVYHRWIDNKGVGGSAPSRNASRRAGEYKSFHIWFRAPRFDAPGKKTENARFVRVLHNGLSVQKGRGTRRADARAHESARGGDESADAAGRSWSGSVSQHVLASAAADRQPVGLWRVGDHTRSMRNLAKAMVS